MKRASFLAAAAAGVALPAQPAWGGTLNARVRAIARSSSGVIGVYARTLAPGPALISYRADEAFPTASTIKALIMTTAYALEESKPGTLDATVAFDRQSDLIDGSDFMSEQPDGAQLTVRQLIVPMIQLSDNTASNLLIGHFGVDTIDEIGAQAGMDRTHLARKFLDSSAIVRHQDNVSTPFDLAHLLYLIEHAAREDIATIVTPADARAMIHIMLGQTDRNKIPAGLPAGTSVANKTGEITGTRNDIAIVEPFGDSPFVIAIMTKEIEDYDSVYEAIHEIAHLASKAASRTFS